MPREHKTHERVRLLAARKRVEGTKHFTPHKVIERKEEAFWFDNGTRKSAAKEAGNAAFLAIIEGGCEERLYSFL